MALGMRVLVITPRYPMFDRASGDYRLFQMLNILARRHEVVCACYESRGQVRSVGEAEAGRYRDALIDVGIHANGDDPLTALTRGQFDLVLFEFHFAAHLFMTEARLLQRRAVKVIDSVDVGFNRLFAKARLTGDPRDLVEAERKRRAELAEYARADQVIAVSDEDLRILAAADPGLSLGVVPNMHPMRPLESAVERDPESMLFVGNFRHEPNRDAVQYLCTEVLPLIWRQAPNARLRIIGDPVSDELRAFAEPRVEILGHVADLEPYLRRSWVSVAPLRYGGGMKGKVGEAFAAGLPVVTTPFGVEGYGLEPGRQALVASDPQGFSDAVIRLFREPALYDSVREAAWAFMAERFSVEPVAREMLALLDRMGTRPTRALSLAERIRALVPTTIRHRALSMLSERYR
jgi:glycosyltransferase involved in cell wall biosynthesis